MGLKNEKVQKENKLLEDRKSWDGAVFAESQIYSDLSSQIINLDLKD